MHFVKIGNEVEIDALVASWRMDKAVKHNIGRMLTFEEAEAEDLIEDRLCLRFISEKGVTSDSKPLSAAFTADLTVPRTLPRNCYASGPVIRRHSDGK